MSALPRIRVAVSGLVVLALSAFPGYAQPVPPPLPPSGPPDPLLGASPDPVQLPTNRKSMNQINAARVDYIPAKDWVKTVTVLQRVLDEPEDSLLETEEKDAQGKVVVRRTSARAEAEHLLAALPRAALAVYRVREGGLALVALSKARANPLLLDEVVRRYYLTDAGAEALTLMGVSELDRGRVEEAADRFRRLLQRPDVDDLPPLTLFQAALAFHAANDAGREARAVQILGRRIGAAGLPVGGQILTLDDLRKEIARWPATPAVSADWPLFRGDLRRSGRSDGDFPLLEPRSRAALPVYDEVNQLLAPTPTQPLAYGGPWLPGFVPIAVSGRLVYRGPDGLHGLDAESGKEVWRRATPMCLESVLNDDQKKWQLRRWLGMYRGLPTLLDENATLGVLSSDGRRVYFVEDLPAPPHATDIAELIQQQAQAGGPRHWFSTAKEHLYHNELWAVDALTGDVRWKVGAWRDPDAPPEPAAVRPPGTLECTDAFFLGAPLPVGRRLFALVERHNEINLLCLDSETGGLLWSQNLATSPQPLWLDPARRMQPAQLAYADGVVLCPTGVGVVVAVDPVSHNLLWAHEYRDRVSNADAGGNSGFAPDQYETSWRGCAPIVHGDRVVLTAPDGDSVRCLNLHDGTLIWTVLRTDEDLYVGGVFEDKAGGDKVLVVGKSTCRALSLATGAEVWPQAVTTGIAPSGLGAASGKSYFLPLRDGDVFVLDVTNPQASTRIEGRAGEPLGNLVFHGGDLWSQSPTAVTAYPQLGKGLESAQALVAKNPRDPAVRINRGRLLYSKGDAAHAVEDWLFALENNPPAELVAPTRERLFNVLTQLLQEDFPANEKHLDSYRKLCLRTAPADAAPEQVEAARKETRRRMLTLAAIVAHGREVQGRMDLALKAYQELYESAAPGELMTAPEDPTVRLRPDLWVQGRIAALAAKATPEQRKALQEQIDQEWRAAQTAAWANAILPYIDKQNVYSVTAASPSGDADPIVRFIALYGTIPGPLGAAGREARLTLAERWIDQRDRRHALEAELHLHYLRQQSDSPEIAARAQYEWARLLTRHGLLAEAVEAYRNLARDFPTVVVHDGKTGPALLDDLAADKRFFAYLDDPLAVRPPGRVKVVEIQEKNTLRAPGFPCEPSDGVTPPSCRNLRLSVDPATFTLQVVNTDGSTEPWSIPLPVPAAYLRQYIIENSGYTVNYQASDHFLVVSLGPLLVGVDRIERRTRWVRSLVPPDLPPNAQLTPNPYGVADGSVGVQINGGAVQRFGLMGPIGPNGVFVQTQSGLAALDLATGDLRWMRTRSDSAAMLEVFGDEQHLYLAEVHAAGDVRAVRAIRTADGVSEPIPDGVAAYNHKLFTNLGRCLLVSDPAPGTEAVHLRFYDVQTGKDLWEGTFPPHSVVLESPVPELAAVAAPNGTVTVVDLLAHKELLRLTVDPRHVNQLVRGMLLRDRTQYYLALQGPPSPVVAGDPTQNFTDSMNSTVVNGMIYAFDRTTGELHWTSQAEAQVLLLNHFEESPVLLMTAIQQRPLPGAPGGNMVQWTCTRSIDKQTGKVLYRKQQENVSDPFYDMEIDVRTGAVDLINSSMRLRHYIESGKDSTDQAVHH